MSDEKNNINNNQVNNKSKSFDSSNKKSFPGKKRFGERPKEEFEQRILDIARVTRVMKGGKRMSFRACVAIGDKKGRIAVALGKGADVTLAVNKAVNKAKKNIVFVPIVNDTIPHEINNKFGSAKILLKPASQGRGVIAGGVVRVIMDLVGIKNISSKILGTNNKINNAKCTILALDKLRKVGPLLNAKKAEIKKEDQVKKIEEKDIVNNK
ncbi:MAG: 30S ribosomal protein S5 [Patescibacteria group bacterium]|nr:30S ribosomal protein S5 [Patescibacteria group bacterium]